MRPGILFRYVLRQLAASTLVVGVVLLVVLATYQLAFALGRAADGQVTGAMVPELALLSLRSSLPVILPFALLIGIVLSLGRMHHDNEIAAAQACGVSTASLIAAAGVVTLAATLLAAWAAFIDGPRATSRIVELRAAAMRGAALRQLPPGTFRALGHGITLYFGASDAAGEWRDVFVQRDLPGKDARVQVLVARSARQRIAPDGAAWLVELDTGHSYEGAPGGADWRIGSFARQLLRIPLPQAQLTGPPRLGGMSNAALLASGQPRQMAELHWRLAWVIDVLVLGLAAVPLARLAPRQGRYARLPWAVLVFALYAGLLTAGRTMLGRGELPQFAGLWWAHAAAVAVCWWLLRTRWLRS